MFILDSISNYTPKDEREAQSVCERVTPRLAHANAAVVLSAVKVLYHLLSPLSLPNTHHTICRKKRHVNVLLSTWMDGHMSQYMYTHVLRTTFLRKPEILSVL